MTKEIHAINTRALDFVVELIEYIFEYPDDDYMTMECLCRKLVKHGLLDKADGYYQTHDLRTNTHECVKDTHDKDEPTTEDCSTVSTISKMEQVDKDINVRCKDEPRTERMNTHDYCDICNHKGCGNCIANNLDDYCVPSGYEPITQTETQNSNLTFEKRTMRDCYNCKRYETEVECIECHYEPKDEPQTERSEE